MKTEVTRILNEMSKTEINNAATMAENLLQIIGRGCEKTKQRRFACDIYIELLLFKNMIDKELIWRKRLR